MKIFISIASYCDELLFFTLKDCFQKAKYKESLIFAVVDQNEKSFKHEINNLSFATQIRYVYIHKLETFGVSWARNIVFSLFDNEDYLLQIDSHTLFEENWDEKLLEQYNTLLKISKKPILSTYPYDFQFNEKGEAVYKENSRKWVLELRPHPDTLLKEDSAVLRFRAEHKLSDTAVHGCHIAAGFIFTSSIFIEEIPYDPYLYFHGEEQSLSIRAYTRGWDIYHPTWIPLYHHYKKSGTSYLSHHWHNSISDKRALGAEYLKARAIKRINRLFYGDGMIGSIYGLGNVRTLEEFINFSGIDYKNKTIQRLKL